MKPQILMTRELFDELMKPRSMLETNVSITVELEEPTLELWDASLGVYGEVQVATGTKRTRPLLVECALITDTESYPASSIESYLQRVLPPPDQDGCPECGDLDGSEQQCDTCERCPCEACCD